MNAVLTRNRLVAWDNRVNEAARCVNTERPLTHSLDLGKERLMPNSTQCSVPECDGSVHSRNLCPMHYYRQRVHGSLDKPGRKPIEYPTRLCSIEGCDKKHRSQGLCKTHYSRLLKTGGTEYLRQRGPTPKPAKEPYDARSPLRRAYDAGDRVAIITTVLGNTHLTSTGCRLWKGKPDTKGYPKVRFDKTIALHRLVLEALIGKPLGSQQSHHTCANAMCVNPDHLQPVTHVENLAEMKARRSYQLRIRELEAALAQHDPNHPLLGVIDVR